MKRFFKLIFRMFLFLLFLALLVSLLVTYSSYPSSYEAKPISGVVFDAESKQPVEGAVVVAIWSEYGGAFQAYKIDELEVQEAVTDNQGKYTLPGWPLKRSRNRSAFVPTDEPRIFAYKYRYLPKYIYNGIVQEMGVHPPYKHERMISWHGSTDIFILPLTVTEKDRMQEFTEVEWITPGIKGCRWKKLTHLLLEVDKHREDLENYFSNTSKNGTSREAWYLKEVSQGPQPACAGAVELLTNARKLRQNNIDKK